MLYEPKFRPKPIVSAWEAAAITIVGVPAIWALIHGFFGAMPLLEQLGHFICHHLFDI